jgi:hypothetical protein
MSGVFFWPDAPGPSPPGAAQRPGRPNGCPPPAKARARTLTEARQRWRASPFGGEPDVPASAAVIAPATTIAQQRAFDLLLPAAVADRLGVSTKVLERWRGTGAGLAFVRLTRKTLRYRTTGVDAFIAASDCANIATA